MNGKPYPDGFTIVDNRLIDSEELSFAEIGLYCFLASKPGNWNFSGHRIAKHGDISYPTAVKLLQKLESKGLLVREQGSGGRVKYHLPPLESSKLKSCEKLLNFEYEKGKKKGC